MISQTRTDPRAAFWSRTLTTISVVLALACGWWAVTRGAQYALNALRYHAPLDGQEGMALWEASLLRTGRGLYLPVVPEYFVSAPYPPLHPVLVAVFGQSADPNVFRAGRALSLLAALLVALGGYALVRRVTDSPLGGIAAAVAILSFTPLQIWALRIKPDMTGLALTVAGLWLIARWQPQPEPTHRTNISFFARLRVPASLGAAALAFALAHFSKQTMLAGPAAAFTYIALHNRRTALRCGLLYLALVGVTWLLLDLVTRGQYTYHVWVLHKLDWTGARFWKFAIQLRDLWPLLILGLIGLVTCWRRPTVINAYLLWAPASLIAAGVEGSHHNHLLETGVALALVGGQAIGFGITRGGIVRVLAPVLLGTQLLVWRAPLPWFADEYDLDQQYTRYIDFVRATPGEIMANDLGLVYAAGRALPYDDPAAMGPAARRGLWDQRQFVADIRAGRFSAIIMPVNVVDDGISDPSGRWTREMLQAIRDSYDLKFGDTQNVYVPKPTLAK